MLHRKELLFLLAKLYQHPIGCLRMQEADQFIIGSILRYFIQQFKAERRQALHFGMYVFHLKGDVVYARAFFIYEFGYGTGGIGGFQQLYFGIAGLEEGSTYPFRRYFLSFVAGGIQQLLKKGDRGGQFFYSYSQVFYFHHYFTFFHAA